MATVQVNEKLAAITAGGTSIWLDQMRRSLMETGELARMVEQECLRGVTSNPAIFEKAILGSPDYDEHLEQLAREGKSGREVYRYLAIKDVQLACDALRPVWEETGHVDGYVSLEVAPRLARDTAGTIEQARMYWELIDRPNAMIKIPGTDEGLPAVEQMLSEGVNINVTLLFSVEAYEQVMEAFVRGLERRRDAGESLDVHSVASFFVSRVDSEVDKRLEALGRTDLQGRAAVANARAAYQAFKRVFGGERFAALRDAGAPVQRPLWASTGVKNPLYPETKYVDELIAPDTVNTMPLPTLLAAGEASQYSGGATADVDPTDDLEALAAAGIDMKDVTDKLLADGIEAFMVPMEKLLRGVEEVRQAIVTERPQTIHAVIPSPLDQSIAAKVKEAASEKVARRIWKKDDTLWGPAGQPEVANRLGWLTIADRMTDEVDALIEFAAECRADGLTDCVLLGMGGSSLAPEVFRLSFGDQPDGLRLHVLDSTDAGAVLATERAVPLETTLFVVSSKSGGTIETLSHFRHFHARTGGRGEQFVCVTDPGSPLQKLAEASGFRRVFCNDPDIGGRYSALSYFGLVPAALAGYDVRGILERAGVAEQASVNYDHSSANSGLWLGVSLGALAEQGRDKLTFIVSDPISSFGVWAEQLVAESTGKHGKGILPVADEPLGDVEVYGDDRVFAYLRHVDAPNAELDRAVEGLGRAGHPTLTLPVHGPTDLGRIFFFSEFATAVSGWALGINAFDQPNVQAAKDSTSAVLKEFEAAGALPSEADADDDALRALLSGAAPPSYVAIMGYVQPSSDFDAAVAELRASIRARTKATTTFGYGPRFLHSTGQFHKGGPKTGIFLQLVHDGPEDVAIPDAPYTFTTLKNAQAIGDLRTLRANGLPAERVRLEGEPALALRELTTRIEGLL